MELLQSFFSATGFALMTWSNALMIVIGLIFISLAIIKDYEPLLLLPIGFGMIVGNIPHISSMALGVYDSGSVLSYIYFGVSQGIFPPLIFLGIGAMTDFSTMLSNPKLVLLGAAAQIGIFLTLIGALYLGFEPSEAGAIGIIGGADGPTAIFLSAKLAPHLLQAIAIAAYSYMALVPVIQPPIMKLLTTKKERLMRMKEPRKVSTREKILFPIISFLICALLAPGALPLLGMLMFGNLLKESLVTERLANTARNALIDIVTILLGFSVGASTQADYFLTKQSILIFGLGALSFAVATAGGVLFAKFMNLFLKGENKINPLVGAAGVSAVPDSARVVQMVGQKEDPTNFLLMHAMAPNVAGVIGSAIAAGVLWTVLVG
jgi:carboxybiotin decarboxylase